MCFDGFLIWISCKQLESCAFRSIWCKQNFLSEAEMLNQHFEIETINIPDKATNQRFHDTTIIITSSPAKVLYLSISMPFYKKTNWQCMTQITFISLENHLHMVQGKSLSLRMLLTSYKEPKDAAYKLHKAWRRSATLLASRQRYYQFQFNSWKINQLLVSIWHITHLDSNFTQTLFFGK